MILKLKCILLVGLLASGISSCASYNVSLEEQQSSNLRLAVDLSQSQRSQYEAKASRLMISTQGEAATEAAKQMIELGGNAIDAAAAASFVISVERPQSTGLGGGGFMLIHLAKEKKVIAADFREKAPLRAHEKMYLDEKGEVVKNLSWDGVLAAGTPGLVAGVLDVQKKYGKLTRKQILQPAIELAEKGFKVYPHLAKAIEARKPVLDQFPASKMIFLKPDGTPFKEGEKLVQTDLGKTLRAISKNGKNGFYKGWVASALVNESKRLGGLITQKDLDAYDVRYRKPVVGTYKGFDVYSMSPPSSGGVHVIQILNILEQDDLRKLNPQSPEAIHLTASAMQLAYADRAKYLGDSDFVKVPVKGLISKKYARGLRKQIANNHARSSKEINAGNPFPYESDDTTHFTIMDQEGNTVASTQTINGWLGSGVVVPGTGIVLNNEMDDFSAKPGVPNQFGLIGGTKNAVRPGKRPLSSMSPTILMKKGQPILALGTPSGSRIITCVLQTILNYVEYGMPLYESVAAIRFHHQWWPDVIRVEDPLFSSSTMDSLKNMGYQIEEKTLGCKVQAVAREGGLLHGVSDPRGEGLSLGF